MCFVAPEQKLFYGQFLLPDSVELVLEQGAWFLFTAVLLNRRCKTHTPCIHYHLRDKTRRLLLWPCTSPCPLSTSWHLFWMVFFFLSSHLFYSLPTYSFVFSFFFTPDFSGTHVLTVRTGSYAPANCISSTLEGHSRDTWFRRRTVCRA